jgi:hypothetical protein
MFGIAKLKVKYWGDGMHNRLWEEGGVEKRMV